MGHPVERNHTQDSLEDNISSARPGATLAGRTEGGLAGRDKAGGRAISNSQDDNTLVPWELAARSCAPHLSLILINFSGKTGVGS